MPNLSGSVAIPDLIPLLILVLLGELLSPLEDLGALGLASDLGSSKSKDKILLQTTSHTPWI